MVAGLSKPQSVTETWSQKEGRNKISVIIFSLCSIKCMSRFFFYKSFTPRDCHDDIEDHSMSIVGNKEVILS